MDQTVLFRLGGVKEVSRLPSAFNRATRSVPATPPAPVKLPPIRYLPSLSSTTEVTPAFKLGGANEVSRSPTAAFAGPAKRKARATTARTVTTAATARPLAAGGFIAHSLPYSPPSRGYLGGAGFAGRLSELVNLIAS